MHQQDTPLRRGFSKKMPQQGDAPANRRPRTTALALSFEDLVLALTEVMKITQKVILEQAVLMKANLKVTTSSSK